MSAREKLLAAATKLIRIKGYTATTVDDLCVEAGVTKGAFFHHFASKDALGIAAARNWAEMTGALFASASYHQPSDPLDRVFAYIDFRKALLQGDVPDFTCLVGTMVQEVHRTSDGIRLACADSILGHAATLVEDIAAAKDLYAPDAEWEPASLARFTQAALQGAFILAKAEQGRGFAAESVDHLKRYVDLLFSEAPLMRAAGERKEPCQ